ncbi:hypothetical protein K2173_010159 (mitochondrion) [Erythroxylum novogranatense]|nr:hypothetical protein K2173_010159 [Erythroxylum novogranatense]
MNGVHPPEPPENSGLGLIPGAQSEGDGDRPDSNHYPSGSSQEAHQEGHPGSSHPHLDPHQGKRKLVSELTRHIKKHCASQVISEKYPFALEEDPQYFAENLAISILDIDTKTDSEIMDLAKFLKNYQKAKSLIDLFFEQYYREDD